MFNFVYRLFNYLESNSMTVEVDTRSPIIALQKIVGRKLRVGELANHEIYLQDIKLHPMLSLFDQGVKVNQIYKIQLNDTFWWANTDNLFYLDN